MILDDGFQNVRLKRDINIVLIDGHRGFGNGYLLPRGILREPISRLRDADIALVKGGRLKEADSARFGALMLPVMGFEYAPTAFIDLTDDATLSIDEFKAAFNEKEAIAVCGIANPESFVMTLKSIGVNVIAMYDTAANEIYTHEEIKPMLKTGANVVITTEKDGVKLKRLAHLLNVPIFALRVEAIFKDLRRSKTASYRYQEEALMLFLKAISF